MDLFHSFAHLHHPVWYPSTSVFTLGTSSPGPPTALSSQKPLPPAHFTTGYWNTLHDRIIESPHPYTTNWQTMVSVPNARRQAVDRDDSPPRQPPPSNDRPRLMSTAASLPARLCLVPADPVSRFSFAAHPRPVQDRLLLPCTRPALTSSTIRTWLT
ncbi:hypothetical protein PAPYR_13214 [Paratrimastix pyriformis]|uniref:Uncharacterized protein n=1 Tax=Paratrimastix pyriformis TaxID=342808 RepID=A0ABQ8U0M0_9EUKA|nr:hypothetical protein PAPYR_13214 [Paratrimastix pyriformis]